MGGGTLEPGCYVHFKDWAEKSIQPEAVPIEHWYRVVGLVENGDTHEQMVIYIPPHQYGTRQLVRPLDNWNQLIALGRDMKHYPRFIRVAD